MKKQLFPLILLFGALPAAAPRAAAQSLAANNVTSQPAETKAAARHVSLTGRLSTSGNSDFRQLRDLCFRMETLDLSAAACPLIPDNAFHSRHRLKSVRLPDGLEAIGSQAFFACDSLAGRLSVPSGTRRIGAAAFSGCAGITSLDFGQASRLSDLGSYAFARCAGLSGQLVLPAALDTLRDGAFFGCASLSGLVLPQGLRVVGPSAFARCESLAGTLALGPQVRRVGASAFEGCRSLSALSLPDGLQAIGASAFRGCASLGGALVLPDRLNSLGAGAFFGCESLSEVTLPAGLPALPAAVFGNCRSLRAVRIGASRPPRADATAFFGVNAKKCTLHVPKGAKAAYRKADVWKRFRIVDDLPAATGEQAAMPQPGGEAETLLLVPCPRVARLTGEAPLVWLTVGGIDAPDALANEREHAARILRERAGCDLAKGGGETRLALAIDTTLCDAEAYTLDLSDKGARLAGKTPAGVFRGLMTLEQLMRGNGDALTCTATAAVHIEDAPRTHVRELMADPARTFIPFERLKELVPEMARYKYNSLHLHLVDDQGWRIEIKKYPRLTEEGARRTGMDDRLTPVSGYYTQAQMRELVDYAARYHVMIVPEIELPGHEVAAVHCYPQLTCGGRQIPIRTTSGVSDELLCPGEEFVYEFLGNVFRELADVFPSPYVHLGGDEAGNPPLGNWTGCEKCRALKRRLGIATDDRSENWKLQAYLFDRVTDTLRVKHGKTPMFWYETDFKRIQEGCITFAWRHGLTQTAIEAAQTNDARIMLCPGEHCYLDYPMRDGDMPEKNWGMPVTTLRQTYELDPSWGNGKEFEKNHLFGVAGTLWSECIDTPERISYQAYPRALALSEAGWSQQQDRSWESFLRRLRPALRDMQRRGVTFSIPWDSMEFK